MFLAPGSPIPENTPIPPLAERNQKALRAAQVIRLGLMNRAATCTAPAGPAGVFVPGTGLPVLLPRVPNPSLLSPNSMPEFFPIPFNLHTGIGGAAGSLGPGMDGTLPIPIAVQIWQAQQPSARVIHQVSTMDPASSVQGGSGASISSADISGAPQVVPMNVTPEMAIARSPQMMADRRRRRAQKFAASSDRSAGVTWGGVPTERAGVCGQAGGLSPLAILLIASGLGVIVYAVAKK